MNKKGAELGAGIFIILIFLYFALFILIANSVQVFDSELNETYDTISSEGIDELVGYDVCREPRSEYYPDGDVREASNPNNLACDRSIGVNGEEYCDLLEGCNWATISTKFLWWTTSSYDSCNGTINASYYGITDTQTYLFGSEHINNIYDSACVHPVVEDNRSLCLLFGCTWTTITPDVSVSSPLSIINLVGDIFTFRYDFGFTNTNIIFLLNLILVLFPMIGLTLAVWFSIR